MYMFFLKEQIENIAASFAFWHMVESLVKKDPLSRSKWQTVIVIICPFFKHIIFHLLEFGDLLFPVILETQ